jgi:hypothetical protein
VFPLVDTVRHLASTSSKDQWHGKELGTEGGKPVHMLVHHRYISLLIQHQLLNFLMGDFSPRIQNWTFPGLQSTYAEACLSLGWS